MANDPLMQGLDSSDSLEDGTTAQGADPSEYEVRERGYGSRKLWYAVATSTGIALGGVLYALCDGFRGAYSTYIGGMISVLALYTGGNVASRHVVSRHIAQLRSIGAAAPLPPRVEPLPPADQG